MSAGLAIGVGFLEALATAPTSEEVIVHSAMEIAPPDFRSWLSEGLGA